jgi:hypothetical protein
MKVTVVLCTVLVLAVSVGATELRKTNLYIGAGLGIPTGDANKGWNVGLHGRGGVGIPTGPNSQIMPMIEYHSFSMDKKDTNASGGTLSVLMLGLNGKIFFTAERQKTSPYVIGGIGLGIATIGDRVSPGFTGFWGDEETKVYFNFGAGVDFSSKRTSAVFIEARYVTVSTSGWAVTYVPISLGIKF